MQINVGSITTEKELHETLANSLGFPDFYGKNWDAFWDSITGLVDMPNEIAPNWDTHYFERRVASPLSHGRAGYWLPLQFAEMREQGQERHQG